ncbi:hypothetical protein KM043_012094 [Ampulex compressa]|nr:hypothetical protein KM043_012094 [Ampulex compressa]
MKFEWNDKPECPFEAASYGPKKKLRSKENAGEARHRDRDCRRTRPELWTRASLRVFKILLSAARSSSQTSCSHIDAHPWKYLGAAVAGGGAGGGRKGRMREKSGGKTTVRSEVHRFQIFQPQQKLGTPSILDEPANTLAFLLPSLGPTLSTILGTIRPLRNKTRCAFNEPRGLPPGITRLREISLIHRQRAAP